MATLFLVTMIVEAIFAVGFIFIPGEMLSPYGVMVDETSAVLARLFGSALISFPVLLWFARESDSMAFKKGVIYSMFAYYLVSTVHLILTQIAGLMNVMGYAVIILHLLFLIWYAYYIVK